MSIKIEWRKLKIKFKICSILIKIVKMIKKNKVTYIT